MRKNREEGTDKSEVMWFGGGSYWSWWEKSERFT